MLHHSSYGCSSRWMLWQPTAGAAQTLQMVYAQQFGGRRSLTVTQESSAACTLVSGSGLAMVRLLPA
jgi:hypothetical protein